ncbi:HPP family protein [Amycolatopsis orientalis]|uniref:HPP family protein n=1 Tax=Amycolatopsis orientalis TaxID=31958 RepID=UPI0003F75706|nr:HPP family protein [Amycolatopsis orientalis]
MKHALPILLTAVGAGGVAAAGIGSGIGPAASAPLAASLALVLANPALPSARPAAVFGGHALAVLGGAITALLLAPGPVAVAVAAAAGLGAMLLFRVVHPPAVASGCLMVLQPLPTGVFLLGAAAALAVAILLRTRFTAKAAQA